MHIMQSRHDFVATVSAVGAAGLVGAPRVSLADEGPPETTTIRLGHDPTMCVAPGLIAEPLLRAEGFTDIRYMEVASTGGAVLSGEIDFSYETAAWVVSQLDAGQPITALAGIHVGCYELFAHEPIRAISDLEGKRVGIPQEPGSSGHMLLAVMAAQVGLDPHTDINWITKSNGDFRAAFAEGEVDAFLAFPPEPQEQRARNVGRVILNTATDRPRSQYLCCIALATGISSGLIRSPPNATCVPF